MLKDITLGQFFPGDTLAHKLDPRTKLLVTVFYVVALFTAKSYIAYGLLILTLIVAVRISRVGAKALFKGLKPVLFIIAFTALLNLFYTPGTELCHFWIFRITIEGVRAAITMMLRITLLIMGTFLLTYTTSPIRLTDGLESLLGPLKKIKVPVHELAMMMSIALRFIPTLIEETDKIMSAQKARGADFETGSLMQRAKALVPLLVPLFVSAFRRADELATGSRLWCQCSSRCSFRPSAVRTSWPWPWNAAATTATKAARSSMCCTTRRATIWCSAIMPCSWPRSSRCDKKKGRFYAKHRPQAHV